MKPAIAPYRKRAFVWSLSHTDRQSATSFGVLQFPKDRRPDNGTRRFTPSSLRVAKCFESSAVGRGSRRKGRELGRGVKHSSNLGELEGKEEIYNGWSMDEGGRGGVADVDCGGEGPGRG